MAKSVALAPWRNEMANGISENGVSKKISAQPANGGSAPSMKAENNQRNQLKPARAAAAALPSTMHFLHHALYTCACALPAAPRPATALPTAAYLPAPPFAQRTGDASLPLRHGATCGIACQRQQAAPRCSAYRTTATLARHAGLRQALPFTRHRIRRSLLAAVYSGFCAYLQHALPGQGVVVWLLALLPAGR